AAVEVLRRPSPQPSSAEVAMHQKLMVPMAVGLGVTFLACTESRNPTEASHGSPMYDMGQNARNGASSGTTLGWDNGMTVTFFYTKEFFCRQPPSSGAPSQCEVGADGTVDPRPGKSPVLYVMTPIGFRPPDATLHCPIVGSCINHPSTIDLSRVFGAGFADVPLPAHS